MQELVKNHERCFPTNLIIGHRFSTTWISGARGGSNRNYRACAFWFIVWSNSFFYQTRQAFKKSTATFFSRQRLLITKSCIITCHQLIPQLSKTTIKMINMCCQKDSLWLMTRCLQTSAKIVRGESRNMYLSCFLPIYNISTFQGNPPKFLHSCSIWDFLKMVSDLYHGLWF